MRIVHVTDSFLPRMGGIERQVDSLSLRQAARGDDVTIVCAVAAPVPDAADERRHIRRPAQWGGTQVAYHRARRVAHEVDLHDVDVVHAHLSVFSPLAALALRRASRAGVPTVATVHSLWTPGEGRAAGIARAGGLLGEDTTAWSAVSRVAASRVGASLGTPVHVLPNGVDAAFWNAPRTPASSRTFRVATVMRLVGRKRPLPFVAMMAELRRRLPVGVELQVTIVGEGPQRPAVLGAVRRAGLQSQVGLEGRLSSSRIRDIFAASDVYLAPARYESFGIAALEARCAGLPVVAFASSGVADIVTGPATGCLVTDDDGMVDALVELATSPPADAGVREPCSFDWPVVLGHTDELYAHAGRGIASAGRTHRPALR